MFGQNSETITFKEALFSDDKPCVVVSAEAPHEIEHVSQAFCELYGLGEDEMFSRTLRMIHGARTNLRLFSQKLKDSARGQKQDGQFFCYTKDCREISCDMQTVPVVGDCGQITHILVSLAPVREVEVAQDVTPGVEEDFCAPFDVFGAASFSVKKDFFDGPSANPDDDAGFSADDIFFAAKDRPADLPSQEEESKPVDAICKVPPRRYVVPKSQCDADRSLVQHVPDITRLVPWPEVSNASDDTEDSQVPVRDGMAEKKPFPAPGSRRPSTIQQAAPEPAAFAPTFAEQMGEVDGEGDGQTLRLFRRKKHGGESCAGNELAGPVDISLKMLRDMSDLSLKEASQRLGLSTSAMKKACRKLGVERWPIQSAKTPVIQYNSAYVRRLYCKYAKTEEAKADELQKSQALPPCFLSSDLHGCFNAVPPQEHPLMMPSVNAVDWPDASSFFGTGAGEVRAPAYEQAHWDAFSFAAPMEQHMLH
eukprot:CAMPEP_0196721210 /NCGR_PEP_ID=MMETSP1091-20130531/3851_1 /TAXON_ID=302021 /ORGANISM="Rhodomonas sp., Strain CCMP768" /LENGTH=478 /DNA_ID=CAMNT_0042062643 /DNA_START=101 /DNA_END=1537 /DNA_ORIENTATION=+